MTEIQTIEQMTAIETSYLAEYEQTIESGLRTFYAVGAALVAIRQQRLYRASHGTFEDYCRERWGISKSNANRLITAADGMSVRKPVVKSASLIARSPGIAARLRPIFEMGICRCGAKEKKPITPHRENERLYRIQKEYSTLWKRYNNSPVSPK